MKKTALLFVMIFSVFLLSACARTSFSANFGKERKEGYTAVEKEFIQTADKLIKLENLAYSYYSSDELPRMLIYVRAEKYNSGSWKLLAGSDDEGFVKFVDKRDGELRSLRKLETIISPRTGGKVDFPHLMATCNMLAEGEGDVGGWGGDVTEIIKGMSDIKGTLAELTDVARERIGADGSGIGEEDLNADLDAVNIWARYNADKKSGFTNAFADYYFSETASAQKLDFIKNLLGSAELNAENLADKLYSRLQSNVVINYLMFKNCTAFGEYGDHVKACCTALAEYLLSA